MEDQYNMVDRAEGACPQKLYYLAVQYETVDMYVVYIVPLKQELKVCGWT